MKACDRKLVEYVIAMMAAMPTHERVEVFDALSAVFCPNCGGYDGGRCNCQNDE